jgi:hypothetical protein
MESESKKILVKFLGVFLLVISVILLIRQDKNFFLLGLVVFAIAIVVLVLYNIKKRDFCSNNPAKGSGAEESISENKKKVIKK